MGNVGRQKGGMKWPLIAAYLTMPAKYFMDESTAFTLMIFAAAFAFDTYEKEWRPKLKTDSSRLRYNCYYRTPLSSYQIPFLSSFEFFLYFSQISSNFQITLNVLFSFLYIFFVIF